MNLLCPALVLFLGTGLILGAQEELPGKRVPKPAPVKPRSLKTPKVKPVQLNTASKAELMKVPGITEDLAGRIIAQRPYLTKTNLVTRKILSLELYLQIKHRVSARQPQAK
jgi:DNA uptake protein ComE-like DNA-binding protein